MRGRVASALEEFRHSRFSVWIGFLLGACLICGLAKAENLVPVLVPRTTDSGVQSEVPFYYRLVFEHSTFNSSRVNRNLVNDLIGAAYSKKSERSLHVKYIRSDHARVLSEKNYMLETYSTSSMSPIRLLPGLWGSQSHSDQTFGATIAPWRPAAGVFGDKDTLVFSVGSMDQQTLNQIGIFAQRVNDAGRGVLPGLVEQASMIEFITSTANYVFSGAEESSMKTTLGDAWLTPDLLREHQFIVIVPKSKEEDLKKVLWASSADKFPSLTLFASADMKTQRERIPYALFRIDVRTTLIGEKQPEAEARQYLQRFHAGWQEHQPIGTNKERALACLELSRDIELEQILLPNDKSIVVAVALKTIGYDPDRSAWHAHELGLNDGTKGRCLTLANLRLARERGIQIGSCKATSCRLVQDLLVAWNKKDGLDHYDDVAFGVKRLVEEGSQFGTGLKELAGSYEIHHWYGDYAPQTESGCPTGTAESNRAWKATASILDRDKECKFDARLLVEIDADTDGVVNLRLQEDSEAVVCKEGRPERNPNGTRVRPTDRMVLPYERCDRKLVEYESGQGEEASASPI